MEGVIFLISIIAVGLIMLWVIQNDSAGPGEPTRGLFAMPDTAPKQVDDPAPRPASPQRPDQMYHGSGSNRLR